MTEPLRLGVLGAARISERPSSAGARDRTRLVAVAARDRARAEEFAAAHDVERVLDSYADVIADPEVEAIYNPLANGLHGPWNLAAIEAVSTCCPRSRSRATRGGGEVRDAAAKADVVVLEGFHYLFHP